MPISLFRGGVSFINGKAHWENQGLISPWENLVALQNTCMLSRWTITSHDKGI